MPIFHELVKKLVNGVPVSRIAQWAFDLNPDGEMKNAGLLLPEGCKNIAS
jgi:hypothetical protein